MEQKKLSKEFLNKGWRPQGLHKLWKNCKKLARRQDGSTESMQNLSCFSIL